MEESKLTQLVDEGLSTREIAGKMECSQSNVRYWVKKFGLQLKRGPRGRDLSRDPNLRLCAHCGEDNQTKFYERDWYYCKKCKNEYTVKRQQVTRAKAIEYKGGHCERCGFGDYNCALDFHHTDPANKDPSFSNMSGWSWSRVKSEIDQCQLLCRNCHAIVHWLMNHPSESQLDESEPSKLVVVGSSPTGGSKLDSLIR